MTRINVVPAEELSREHLIAEYRELPRIFNLVRKAQARGEKPDLSEVPHYTLGPGHVRFFYPRLAWVENRYFILQQEMKRRGYFVREYVTSLTAGIKSCWRGTWLTDEEAIKINRQRIKERTK